MLLGLEMRRATLTAIFLFAALSLLAADHPLAGNYAIDRASSESIDRAIDQAVKKLNFITRPIARSRLHNTNPAYDHISLAFSSTHATVTAGPTTLKLPLDGSAIVWNRDGEKISVNGRMQGASFVETFDAKDGRRTNTFSPRDDGIAMTVTVTSPRLPAALHYTLVYRKH